MRELLGRLRRHLRVCDGRGERCSALPRGGRCWKRSLQKSRPQRGRPARMSARAIARSGELALRIAALILLPKAWRRVEGRKAGSVAFFTFTRVVLPPFLALSKRSARDEHHQHLVRLAPSLARCSSRLTDLHLAISPSSRTRPSSRIRTSSGSRSSAWRPSRKVRLSARCVGRSLILDQISNGNWCTSDRPRASPLIKSSTPVWSGLSPSASTASNSRSVASKRVETRAH